jgi:hypothetical protein
VYHLFSRIVYRAIGRENLRNRRAHSLEHIRTRLVALDFVLAHLQYEYLETEDDKLNYFCQQLDIPKELLPVKRYSRAIRWSFSGGRGSNITFGRRRYGKAAWQAQEGWSESE